MKVVISLLSSFSIFFLILIFFFYNFSSSDNIFEGLTSFYFSDLTIYLVGFKWVLDPSSFVCLDNTFFLSFSDSLLRSIIFDVFIFSFYLIFSPSICGNFFFLSSFIYLMNSFRLRPSSLVSFYDFFFSTQSSFVISSNLEIKLSSL